jgi:hypothetical protein
MVTPDRLDALHLGLLTLLCLTVLVLPFAVAWDGTSPDSSFTASVADTNTEPEIVGVAADVRLRTVDQTAELDDADIRLWAAADSQPSTTQNGSFADWERLNTSIEDISGLEVTPNLTALLGDIPDPINEVGDSRLSPRDNIERTRASFNRLSWFDSQERHIYTAGNHERGHLAASATAFSGQVCDPATLTEATVGNIKLLGFCSGPDNRWREDSLDALRNRLDELSASATDWNVFAGFHHPVEGTVTNCHTQRSPGIDSMPSELRERYLNLTERYAGTFAATLTGHIHGRWDDPDSRPVVKTANHTFIDVPVFGGEITYTTDDGGDCDSSGYGIAESLFITFDDGDRKATAMIRQSCDDSDDDGECTGTAEWTSFGTTTPLPNPVSSGVAQRSLQHSGV